jgi:uncharacterized membrane protein
MNLLVDCFLFAITAFMMTLSAVMGICVVAVTVPVALAIGSVSSVVEWVINKVKSI